MKNRIVSVAAGASLGLALALRSAYRIPVFDLTSETSAPWMVTSIPPLLWFFATVGFAAGLGAFLPRRAATPFLLVGLGASAIFVPKAYELAPFLAAFSGRFLDFVLVGCVLSLVWRFGRMPLRMTANRVSAVAFCVFVAVGFKMSSDVGLSGDEPHYLLITHSILEDGDLRVQNNYVEKDYQHFYRGKIGPHLAAGTPYSVHGIGLPLLLVPGYAVAGMSGVLVTLAFLGTLLVGSIFRVGRNLGVSDEAAALAAFAFALTSPALFLCVSAYPELPAAVVVMVVFARLSSHAPASHYAALGFSTLVGTLPFLHMKFLPLAIVLWLALAVRLPSKGARVAIGVGASVGAIALVVFFYYTTGSFDPTSSYGRQRIFISGIPLGVAGLLFDQEYGLAVFAPVYLVGLVGLVTLVRRHPFLGVVAVCVLGAVALPGAAHPLWSGGNSPPARFLFPALPLVALAAGCLWSWERKWGIAPWLPALLILSLSVASFTVFLPGQPLYLNARDGTGRLWEALSSSWDLTPYLPSIVTNDLRSLVWASTGFGVVVVACALQYGRRAVRLPGFVVLLLAAAWTQDLTGVTQPRTQSGRWVSGFMRQLADRQSDRFLAVPSFERLDSDAVMDRVALRLMPLQPDGDPRHWWSLPYSIPSGRYRVSGIARQGWAPCNDRNCFEVESTRFESAVALARFRVRARRLEDTPPQLHFESVHGAVPVAERSLAVSGGRRLHGLDDEAYLDPKGFWVKREARAVFALESDGELGLSNGGRDNTVLIRTASGTERFELAPWAHATFLVPQGNGASVFSVESEAGFRPSELDPEAADNRDLGVLVGTPRF
ncbi:MAG: hypothetical protein BMS9Abin37_1400 [Acidobacteriota bacterium]|nr:MAG: hypothetical protein BMS9Abin37_1400 [Acidobacteriota bacterium]